MLPIVRFFETRDQRKKFSENLVNKQEVVISGYNLKNFYRKMVNRRILLPVMSGNILMIVSGAFTVWPVIYFDKVFHSRYFRMFFIFELIGQIIGSIIFSLLAELIGRRYSLLLMTFPAIISVIISEFFYGIIFLFCIARICSGMIVGGSFAVLPIYVAEISETNSKGGFISSMFIFYHIGEIFILLLTDITYDYFASTVLVSLFIIVLAIAYCITFALIAPESPYYYLKKERHNVAKIVLNKLRAQNINTDIELIEMQGQVNENGQNAQEYERIMVCVRGPGWVKSGIMMFGILVSQIVISIGVVATIFSLYYYIHGRLNASLIRGVAAVLTCCISTALVDKIGRKLLLMISYVVIAVSAATIIILSLMPIENAYVFLLPTVILIGSQCFLLILQTILLAELFPLKIKMISSASFTALWFGSQIVTQLLIDISELFKFFPVVLISVAMLPIVRFFYLETKGKSLQRIQSILNKK
ncbi:unnamed protein product [Psylliodes chrysocephalus]|uniref:Major facilitator superfamily (MFS) profile domain-containing protein n=1 Tax=Psylliodes chrysocephalus TaxID=3402493 RepID=A0A9P0G9Y9_9CUCU|nr:unnamed protein product [Psylliodes chrysocephala]